MQIAGKQATSFREDLKLESLETLDECTAMWLPSTSDTGTEWVPVR